MLQVIKDPRRLINCDETPQAIDVPQKGSRKKVAKRARKAAKQTERVNRESITVMMSWDLSGHNYGVQLVLKRKEISDDMHIEADSGDL